MQINQCIVSHHENTKYSNTQQCKETRTLMDNETCDIWMKEKESRQHWYSESKAMRNQDCVDRDTVAEVRLSPAQWRKRTHGPNHCERVQKGLLRVRTLEPLTLISKNYKKNLDYITSWPRICGHRAVPGWKQSQLQNRFEPVGGGSQSVGEA